MSDHPQSPRKTMSSMSQAARAAPATQQKKPGAPKPKGAVRAKSGCYTCRIRRKKCDEQPNEDGFCQTCVRLRLQCLGFGAKRPDWMRENNSVTELRDKIKTFLASQGMIKGHSGSGPRSADQDPPMLILVENLRSSPSSPPTPTLSASSNDNHRVHSALGTSYEREGTYNSLPHNSLQPPEQTYTAPTNWNSTIPVLSHDPRGSQPHHLPPMNDMMYAQQQPHLLPLSSSSPSLVSPPQSSWHATNGASSSYPTSYELTYPPIVHAPAIQSSFGQTYTENYVDTDEDSPPMHNMSLMSPMTPLYPASDIPHDQIELVHHYLTNVLPIQYLLADRSINDFMIKMIMKSSAARDAACVLSSLHYNSVYYPPNTAYGQDNTRNAELYRRVESSLASRRNYSEGDAMAGLHIVSTFLFSGGRGQWELYLNIAAQYVRAQLSDPAYYGPEDVLRKCTDSTRFIIKTTMWFDVLASVTMQTVPRFLEVYRLLFGRAGAYIDDPAAAPEISMLPVMGCENTVVLAIAEISNLANWKATQRRLGCLSVPALVERGMEIESKYLAPDAGGVGAAAAGVAVGDDEIAQRRRLTNDVFRASARVYLHTVLSGDYPACPEIHRAVGETIECLRRVPADVPSLSRSVVRSVVFGICIAGCLTDDARQRQFLLRLLGQQQGESVGNVSEVKTLLEKVWRRREVPGRGEPVNWREVMRESHPDALLLV